MRARVFIPVAVILVGITAAYHDIFAGLVRQWNSDDNYSHGFIVLPLAAWFAWERRARLRALTPRPSWAGLALVAGSLAVLLLGVLGAELFLSRVSLLGVIAGTVLFMWGWPHLRALAFPIAFLLLMIPLPAILFNQIAFPLQLFASQVGAGAMETVGVPVLREGNVLILPRTTLEVAEACSGIRSLVSLITLAIVLGQFALSRQWTRVALALAAVPVAIATNALRVAGTGIATHFWSPEAADGFFHAFSGWIVFAVAFAALLGIQRILAWMEDRRRGPGLEPASPAIARA
jgi:exosortase